LHACSRVRRWEARGGRGEPSTLASTGRSDFPAPVTFSNSQPFQSRPNPPPTTSPLPASGNHDTGILEAALASPDPSSGTGVRDSPEPFLLREEAWRGPPWAGHTGYDFARRRRPFSPCLRTRAAAACILWTQPAVRAGLGGAVGSAPALTGAGRLRFDNERGTFLFRSSTGLRRLVCSNCQTLAILFQRIAVLRAADGWTVEEREECVVCALMQAFPFLLDRGPIVAFYDASTDQSLVWASGPRGLEEAS